MEFLGTDIVGKQLIKRGEGGTLGYGSHSSSKKR
jgi:hypothetical protein